jgi:hypothetical protein
VKELLGRVSAVDPEAGAAVRVIGYFDQLIEHRVGLDAVVRGAASLAGCPARLIDEERRLRIRIAADGRHLDAGEPPDDGWPGQDIDEHGWARLLLERSGDGTVLDAMILERAATAARTVLDRPRVRRKGAKPESDAASVEVLLDAGATEEERRRAAQWLGLGERARVLAPVDGRDRVQSSHRDASSPPGSDEAGRIGVGPVVGILELPNSGKAARTALRFTAEGADRDPGPRVVFAEELGALASLAEHIHPGDTPIPDVVALEQTGASASWMLRTLDCLATCTSLRAAADALTVHHSTLQNRLGQASRLLGWDPIPPAGRLRLHLALCTRRQYRNP